MRIALTLIAIALASPAAAGKIEMTPTEARDVAAVIRASNFNCPETKIAYGKGSDAYGTVAKVYCGPRGGDGVYAKAVFRVTMRPDGSVMVQPWDR